MTHGLTHGLWVTLANLQESDPLLMAVGAVVVFVVLQAVAAIHASWSRR
jgi:hypothetical protein